jgi:triosephosphate isomerase
MAALIVGNWKMHGLGDDIATIAALAGSGTMNLWVAPPFTLIDRAVIVSAGAVKIGGQDCHHAEAGAHTGCVSAAMLADIGAHFVIVGHSERRQDNGETDAQVRAKAVAGQAAGLQVILCVGETLAQRDAGQAAEVVAAQLAASLPDEPEALTIAYEPIWAIGTGRIPTMTDIAAMHAAVREGLLLKYGANGHGVRILYGGSVKPDNAGEILRVPDVGGVLVGGASLTAPSLLAIAGAA